GGAVRGARHAARRLTRQRVGAAVPGRGDQAADRVAVEPQGGRPRADLQARAGRRGRERSARSVADPAPRSGGRRRRRRDRRHQPLGVRRTRGARRDRGSSLRGLPARRSVGRARHRAGVRLRRGDLSAAPRRRLGLGARRQAVRMSRVLVTGGAGTIGSAVVRRLLADSQWEVRVADYRRPPLWMREGCEIHTTDLRESATAHAAVDGCSHVIHLAAIVGGIANFHKLPFTLTEVNNALTGAVVHAAVDQRVRRFTYVSSSMVFERATEFPTTEAHLDSCPPPRSAYGFSKLAGEVYTRAAHDQHGLRYTICRPFNAYGPGELPHRDEPGIAHAVPDLIAKVLSGQRPLEIFGSGEQTRTLTHVAEIPDGRVTAMASPAGENEDFNISASQELSVAQLAALIWEACGNDPVEFEL